MSILGFLFKKSAKLKPRLTARLAVDEPVRVKLASGLDQPAILQDVSAGGAALRTHQSMRVGDHLGVSMHLGFDQRYDLQAQVVYARPGHQGFHARYGVRFLAMSDDERFKLDTFVNERIQASQFGVRSFTHARP